MSDFGIRFGHRGSGSIVANALAKNQIKWAFRPRLHFRQVVTLADFVAPAATTVTLDLNTLFLGNTFPGDCDLLEGCTVENLVLPVGGSITALTLLVGGTFDAGVDADGLLTVSSLLGGGAAVGDILQTVGAANYRSRFESGFLPTVQLDSTGDDLDALTAVEFEVVIPWTPRAERSS